MCPPPSVSWCRAAAVGCGNAAAGPFLPVRQAWMFARVCQVVMGPLVALWCPFFPPWEMHRPQADNREQLQLQRRLNASSSVSPSLLSEEFKFELKNWAGLFSYFPFWLSSFSAFFFFPLWCSVLSRPRFWLQFPYVLAIWFLKASCSFFGFCCSCHLVHLQDKRKKLTGGLPPFHPLCSPSKGHSFEHKNLLSA